MATFLLNISFCSTSMLTCKTNIFPLYPNSHKHLYSTKNISKKHNSSYDFSITKLCHVVPLASIEDKEAGSATEVEYQALCNDGLQADLIPNHVALLMDCQKKNIGLENDKSIGCPSLMDIARNCRELGVKVLSVYTLSDTLHANKEEVDFAMNITKLDLDELSRNNIRISVIGNRKAISDSLQEVITTMEETTRNNKSLHIIEAVDYSGRLDIVQACIALAQKVNDGLIQPEEINDQFFQKELETKCLEFPNPDLLIRIGGKYSIDNFMLWQSAYSEIYFVEKDVAQFNKIDFVEGLNMYQKRHRRYGK
uniref:(2Z,6Z)-farnesyl diphosphate synthase CPT6, chloroplastic-like n=1 Tax=Erigeron canadensis TaxID=72917 RepID=UPI001CB99436|nr:(2Z,6Z)-farnesyl diphosphate synthase CPT6, chloroplastic-like [Erigeron canadensis]